MPAEVDLAVIAATRYATRFPSSRKSGAAVAGSDDTSDRPKSRAERGSGRLVRVCYGPERLDTGAAP